MKVYEVAVTTDTPGRRFSITAWKDHASVPTRNDIALAQVALEALVHGSFMDLQDRPSELLEALVAAGEYRTVSIEDKVTLGTMSLTDDTLTLDPAHDSWMDKLDFNRIEVLENAIREHRAQKADDRCIEDDDRLYAVLGDGIKCDRSVGNKEEMLKNCARFIDRRCEGGNWPTYQELEAKIKELEEKVACSDVYIEVLKWKLGRAEGKNDSPLPRLVLGGLGEHVHGEKGDDASK